MPTKELFDKKFVMAAVVLGAVYALVVVLIGKIIGMEAAGVAGIALSALFTGILKKFETLRFRRISDDKSTWVDVPPINIWRVIVLTFAFFGAQYVLGFASGLIPEKWLGEDGFLLFLAGLTLFIYFFLPFLMAKSFTRLRYSTVAFAVLLNQILSILMSFALPRPELSYSMQYGLGPLLGAQGVWCLVYQAVAILGVRLGLQAKFR